MRHGRAKAARKTLRYFERTVNLKNKPYYSVLLDATFLVAMVRITTTTTTTSNNEHENDNSNQSDSSIGTIVSRIERVLQVNGSITHGGNSSRDDRLANINSSYNTSDSNYHHSNNHGFSNYNVRLFIPQEAVDELETIVHTFKDRSEATKKKKKKNLYQAKAQVFQDALEWIKRNSKKAKETNKNISSSNHNPRHSQYRSGGNGRCEVLPRLEPIQNTIKQRKSKKHHQPETPPADENDQASSEGTITISASDAMRRHIARDDGRESKTDDTPENDNDKANKKFSRTYIVASQEEGLLDDLRMMGTVPILRCTNNASVLILENPSKKGQRTDHVKETTKWKCSLQNPAEKALVDAAWQAQKARNKNNNVLGGSSSELTRGAAKKAKGPNPLSCKKRKRDDPGNQRTSESNVSKSKKRRQRAQRNKTTPATSNSEEEQ
mmetsp:Transcript_21061/g.58556  ORF Transcript_21061/g.58556 Transcript_21061/m.58556 type:complete len:438 (-) Transcript_21061:252-1565(-)